MISCPYKKNFGIDCFGCGFQRAANLFFEGKFIESIKMYPAFIPMLIMWIFLVLHLIFKFKKGALWLRNIFIFNVILILTNYLIKHIHV